MKCSGFKDVIEEISQQFSTILTVELKPYRSNRKKFNVLYHSFKRYLNWEMEVKGNHRKITFSTVTGEKHSIWNTAIKTASVDSIEIQNFMGAGPIECRNFKQVVNEINKHNRVLVTISLWTYSSGRMTFNVPFDSIKQCLDKDMLLTSDKSDRVTFVDIRGKEHSFPYDKLKIAKLDYLDIPDFPRMVKSI
ncbi:hypothetical protein CN918_30090 [Priestia megaterium]|nr:hypothetical protein CN918_30090 [Priestia megaterium]